METERCEPLSRSTRADAGLLRHAAQPVDALELALQGVIEDDAAEARLNAARGRRHARLLPRIEAHEHDVAGIALLDERQERRVGREAAVPVMPAVELHR